MAAFLPIPHAALALQTQVLRGVAAESADPLHVVWVNLVEPGTHELLAWREPIADEVRSLVRVCFRRNCVHHERAHHALLLFNGVLRSHQKCALSIALRVGRDCLVLLKQF